MPNRLSQELAECYQHAGDCARQAAAQTDPETKRNFLDMERRWMSLAREILADFSDEKARGFLK